MVTLRMLKGWRFGRANGSYDINTINSTRL